MGSLGAWHVNADNADYASIVTSVTHNGNPSIQVIGGGSAPWGEVDGPWLEVHPGYHVVMSVWVKTEAFAGASGSAPGSWFGWDFYTHYTTLDGTTGYGIVNLNSSGVQAGHPQDDELAAGHTINGSGGLTQVGGLICQTPFGTDWTLLQFDFTVPDTYYEYVTTGQDFATVQTVPFQIDSMVPWIGVRNYGWAAAGHVWYSEPIVNVYPP